jgi:hypothetical protein
VSNTPTLLVERLSPIVEPAHEAFEMCRDRFNSVPNLVRPGQEWARTHFMRCFLWQYLSDNPLPEPWKLTGRHSQNGQINIAYGTGEMVIKVVHAMPSGETPHAGRNRARRAYYTNTALAETSDPVHMQTHRMLLTWHEGHPLEPFILTAVRPLTTGSIRSRVKADIVLPFPRERTAFEDLEFDTSDDLETLDEFNIDDDRDVGGASDE